MDNWFGGRVAIVTGGASGIGLAVASKLLALGTKVAVVDKDKSILEEAYGDRSDVLLLEADVRERFQVERYVAATVERYGRLDMFHNNAGVLGPRAPLIDFEERDFHTVFGVNVLGVLLGLQATAKAMRGLSGGSIVNSASAVGLRSVPNHGLYGSSKAAVLRITQQAAAELGGFGIRVNAIAPGSVDTPALRSSFQSQAETSAEAEQNIVNQLQNRPLGKAITPDDVAELVVWLLGPHSAKITGSINVIDGGVTT